MKITCVFDQCPSNLVIDATFPTSLKDEHLLNENGRLEIVKVFECQRDAKKAKAKGVYVVALHPSADQMSDLLDLKNADLKKRAKDVAADLSSVDQKVNTQLRRAIWATCADLKIQQKELELKSETGGKIWEQLKTSLPTFALFKADRPSTDQDAEAQDPMKLAIKDAIRTQQEALADVIKIVEQQVKEIADRTVDKIRELDPQLASQLTPRVTNKNWDSLFSVSLTGDDAISINKRGSGTRRLVLLSFFRAQAERDALTNNTGVIYAVEEPETSQHPHNQRMLCAAFESLAEKPDCQVILTTHTPVLARRFPQSSLRFVTKDVGKPVVKACDNDAVLRDITTSIGVLPDHKVKAFFGVEGRHDIECLHRLSSTLSKTEADILDLRQAELDGKLVFVPLGGSSLDLWVSRLQQLNVKEFYLMDRDVAPPSPPKYDAAAKQFAAQANTTVFVTSRRELENYLDHRLLVADFANYSGSGKDFDDVPSLLAQAIHEHAEGAGTWMALDKDKQKKKESNAKRRLNSEYADKMTPAMLTAIDPNGEVRTWLKAVSAAIQA